VVQRTVEDERAEPEAARRHVWGGVVKRLREHPDYPESFRMVFGAPVTQDAIGKALATYLRTILSGNSLYDRAAAENSGSYERLTADHFDKALRKDGKEGKETIAALNALLKELDLGREYDPAKPDQAARDLAAGYTLFHGKARCARCHSDPLLLSDGGYHNLGVRESTEDQPRPGHEPGRFATVPLGLKDRSLIGAFRTPQLRALSRTAPYFHDGSRPHLFDVVVWHIRGGRSESYSGGRVPPYLDKEVRDEKGNPLDLKLSEQQVRDLVLFLLALDGEPIVAERDR
jgi:cytochrome c peroxidase